MTLFTSLRRLPLAAVVVLVPTLAIAAPPLPEGFDTECVETILLNCGVAAAGMTSLYGKVHIAYQIQEGCSDEHGIGAGIVLLEATEDEWVPLASDFEGVHYELPRLAEGDEWILHVAGFMMGTGSYNADLLFLRDYDSKEWQPIDIGSWHDEIDAMLPEGLGIWKGVDFNFGDWFWSAYNARTPLWKESDANCCPSGGWAEIEFEIKDRRLVPIRVHYREE